MKVLGSHQFHQKQGPVTSKAIYFHKAIPNINETIISLCCTIKSLVIIDLKFSMNEND